MTLFMIINAGLLHCCFLVYGPNIWTIWTSYLVQIC